MTNSVIGLLIGRRRSRIIGISRFAVFRIFVIVRMVAGFDHVVAMLSRRMRDAVRGVGEHAEEDSKNDQHPQHRGSR